MFVTTATALRIERAEAQLTRAVAEAALASGHAPRAFVSTLGVGGGSYVRPGSPFNKLIGVGLVAPIDEAALTRVEQELRARGEPTRIELATLASLESIAWLSQRGYRLLGFENVLVRSLSDPAATHASSIRVERATAATRAAWRETVVRASSCSDETGVVVDQFSGELIAEAIDDMLRAGGFDRYLAYLDGALAGAASLYLCDKIALLSGSATLPAQRRRGVQAALIAARLDEARARGAELAVITTAPGSQSQANVMKHGFALAYARAILVAPCELESVNREARV
ncbi:MAG TPA: GNAT family N-acetyltransferase [Polyangiaceae bacterium]